MHLISLSNNKSFKCSNNETLLEGAKRAGITLEHSCLSGRCSSCKVLVHSGTSEVKELEQSLSDTEKDAGYILSCVRIPTSDMSIDAEDLSEYSLSDPKIIPTKINDIRMLTDDVIKIILRFPPNQSIKFQAGQYINVIKGSAKRSYSIASSYQEIGSLELFIKKYPNGLMSDYFFNEAKLNDLLRIEGPKGTFFLRNSINKANIIFLATGTGIAPIKSILETMAITPEKYSNISIYLFWGVKYFSDLFWYPEIDRLNIKYFPVLSQEHNVLTQFGHIQNILLAKNIALNESVVYACGSNHMITDAKSKLIENGLSEHYFYSDAFVTSN